MRRESMDYTITTSNDGTYIILKVKGNITRRTALQMNLEAHALGRQLQIRRYFVDVTEAKNTDVPLDDYELAYSDMRQTEGIDKQARVVALVSPNDHSHDFMETVSKNAGLHLKLFTDPDEAKRYLLETVLPER
jgi:hypothetical protein